MRAPMVLVATLLASSCNADPAVEPRRGRSGGGDAVRISGSELARHGPPIVYFGARAAKAVVIESDTLITVLTPEADGPGVVDVSIRYPAGTVFEHPQSFEYEQQGLVLRPDGG